jgi:hypothetical protein
MGKLIEWERKLRRVKEPRLEKDILKILKSEEAALVDANTDQLMRGEDSEGNEIDPPYRSRNYAEFKLFLNPAGVVDLNLTGAFHAKFKLVTSKGWPAYLYSTDKKAPELEGKYGRDIYGVQEETLGDINQSSILPKVQDYFRRDVFELR